MTQTDGSPGSRTTAPTQVSASPRTSVAMQIETRTPTGPSTQGEADDAHAPAFDGDTGTLPPDLRAAVTTLLAERVLHGQKKPQIWRIVVTEEAAIRSFLHNLYLDVIINHDRQVAFKQQVYPDTSAPSVSPRVLLPARTTSVEFAAGVLLLIEECRRAHFTAAPSATVTRAAFNEAFDLLWGAEVTNRVARSRNANASIKALCEEGLLVGPKDGDSWDISPAVEVLYGPAEVDRLARSLSSTDLEIAADSEDDPGDEPDGQGLLPGHANDRGQVQDVSSLAHRARDVQAGRSGEEESDS